MVDRLVVKLSLASITLLLMAQAPAERFDFFVQGLRAAVPASYADLTDSTEQFADARAYLLRLYDGITVRQSYLDEDGRVFDCVRYSEQPALRLGTVATIAPPPPFAPDNDKPEILPRLSFCNTGTFPVQRMTIADILQAGGLRGYFQKSPGVEHLPSARAAPSDIHVYSYGAQTVNSLGGRTDESLYSPKLDQKAGEVFSLEQHWYAGVGTDNNLQTAEVGWQAFPQLYKTRKSVLFSYYTADGYQTTGCYNYSCGAFVQSPSSPIVLAQPFPKYSKPGGRVIHIRIGYTMRKEGWWLSYGDQWVGYYPIALYGSGQLAQYATVLEWGTEAVGSTIFPPEGDGAFGGAGVGGPDYAPAYQARMMYLDQTGAKQVPNVTPQSPSPSCYSAGTPGPLGPKLGYGFTVGGPGGTGC